MEKHIAGKYKLYKKLGNGAFGDIFYGKERMRKRIGIDLKTNEEVAIKLVLILLIKCIGIGQSKESTTSLRNSLVQEASRRT